MCTNCRGLVQSKDGNLKGNLFWEYGKKIAKIMTGSEYDVVIITEAFTNAITTLQSMQLMVLLSETY